MLPLKAYVRNGRIVVVAPTGLPEGTALGIVVVEEEDSLDEMPAEERARLNAVLHVGLADIRAARVTEGDEIVRRLLARS